MILRALYDLYDRLKADPDYAIAAPGYSHQKVAFVVVLERDGRLVDIQDARQTINGKKMARRVLVLGGTKSSGSGINPCFLWDAPSYMLGFDEKRPARAARAFYAFRERHLADEKNIDCPEFSAVCRFLESWEPGRCNEFPVLAEIGSGFGVFQIRGETRFVHQHPAIVSWWERNAAVKDDGPKGQCLITGAHAPIARLHEPKIKGVRGAQASGATIAGFNDPAYWSYGLTQGYNAPVSQDAARRYTTALNTLLDGPRRDKHRLVVGPTTVTFWTDRPTPTEDIFLAFLADGSGIVEKQAAQDEVVRAKVAAFLDGVRKGREHYAHLEDDPERTNYFILGLAAPTPARIAVRFFHRGTLSELLENLRRHHRDIGIERRYREGSKRPDPELPPAWFLLRETAREAAEIPPLLPGTLLEAIVSGARYPDGLYAAVMRRLAADRIVNYPRACVIKGYLVRNQRKEIPMSLDPSRDEPAYRLGRLFAALEKTQQDALENVNATIRDRFYASASATPAAVFPRLLRTYQHHLAKLEGGRKVNREKLVQDILAPLSNIPAHLGLAEQGLFALGYYHQMNAFFTKRGDGPETPEGQ